MPMIEGSSKGVSHDTRKQPIRLILEKVLRDYSFEQGTLVKVVEVYWVTSHTCMHAHTHTHTESRRSPVWIHISRAVNRMYYSTDGNWLTSKAEQPSSPPPPQKKKIIKPENMNSNCEVRTEWTHEQNIIQTVFIHCMFCSVV